MCNYIAKEADFMSMGINGVSQVGAGTQYEAPVVKSSIKKNK
jgi:hypothetical protein